MQQEELNSGEVQQKPDTQLLQEAAKQFQIQVKQQRSESQLDFILIRDGRVNVDNFLYEQLSQVIIEKLKQEEQQKTGIIISIWNRTMEYLALLATKNVYLKGDIACSVHIGKRNRSLIQLMPVYTTQHCPTNVNQLIAFRQFLGLNDQQCKVANDYCCQLLSVPENKQVEANDQTEKGAKSTKDPANAKSVEQLDLPDSSLIDDLKAAVLANARFICKSGRILTPPELLWTLRDVLDAELTAALIARHMQCGVALPTFERICEEFLSLTEVQDQAQFLKKLETFKFQDQLAQATEERMTRKMYRLVFGLTETPIEIKGNHIFSHDFYDPTCGKVTVTRQLLNTIYLKLNRASQKLPEVYRARILAFLQIFHHAVLEEGEDYGKMRVDGVVLYCPKGLADENVEAPKVEELKDFVNHMINPFSV